MNSGCIFCRIVEGSVPAEKVLESSTTLAFLDIHPLERGHTLVIPKRHVERFEELGKEEVGDFGVVVQEVVRRIVRSLRYPSTTLAVNNGKEAGQEVPHLHLHVVPRLPGDGVGPIHALPWPRPKVTPEELRRVGEALRSA